MLPAWWHLAYYWMHFWSRLCRLHRRSQGLQFLPPGLYRLYQSVCKQGSCSQRPVLSLELMDPLLWWRPAVWEWCVFFYLRSLKHFSEFTLCSEHSDFNVALRINLALTWCALWRFQAGDFYILQDHSGQHGPARSARTAAGVQFRSENIPAGVHSGALDSREQVPSVATEGVEGTRLLGFGDLPDELLSTARRHVEAAC